MLHEFHFTSTFGQYDGISVPAADDSVCQQAFASLEYLKEYLSQIIKLAEEVDLNTPVIDALDNTLVGQSPFPRITLHW
jgi:hypothetical protein